MTVAIVDKKCHYKIWKTVSVKKLIHQLLQFLSSTLTTHSSQLFVWGAYSNSPISEIINQKALYNTFLSLYICQRLLVNYGAFLRGKTRGSKQFLPSVKNLGMSSCFWKNILQSDFFWKDFWMTLPIANFLTRPRHKVHRSDPPV